MATGATAYISNTTATAFIEKVYSKMALVARESSTVFADLVNRKFEADAQYGDTINVPGVSNLTTQTLNTATIAAIVYETQTETTTAITISTWAYSAIAIQSATARQVNRDLIETYAPKQGYALALKVDDDLAALVDDFSQTVGTLTQDNTYDDVLRARQYLDDADAPMEDRVMVIAPAAEVGFLKLDYFTHADYAKLQGAKVRAKDRAYVGTWIDTPIYKSTNVEGSNAVGHDNAMFQREALALVMQMEPTSHTFFDVDYLARKCVVEQLYGVKEMRDDHGCWLAGA